MNQCLLSVLPSVSRWRSGSRTGEPNTSARSWRKKVQRVSRRRRETTTSTGGASPPNRAATRTWTSPPKTEIRRPRETQTRLTKIRKYRPTPEPLRPDDLRSQRGLRPDWSRPRTTWRAEQMQPWRGLRQHRQRPVKGQRLGKTTACQKLWSHQPGPQLWCGLRPDQQEHHWTNTIYYSNIINMKYIHRQILGQGPQTVTDQGPRVPQTDMEKTLPILFQNWFYRWTLSPS